MNDLEEMILAEALLFEREQASFETKTKQKIKDDKLIEKAFRRQLSFLGKTAVMEPGYPIHNIITHKYLDLSEEEFCIFREEFIHLLSAMKITYSNHISFIHISAISFDDYIRRSKRRKEEELAERASTIRQSAYR
jgi:hypothetical protein